MLNNILLALIVISICLLVSIVSICLLSITNYRMNKVYKEENNKLSSTVTKLTLSITEYEKKFEILSGTKALYLAEGLSYDGGDKFSILYEFEIIDVSGDRVKCKSISFTSGDKIGRDPKYQAGINAYIENKWVPKKDIDIIIDDRMRRDTKLKDILNES